jgi:uncharacterized protein YndB with AHSA1/START domain
MKQARQQEPAVTLQVKRTFEVPSARVFDAWVDPATAGRWLYATPTGQMVRVEMDRRVHGRWCITERRDGVDVEHSGEYLEIARPHRLVFTFAVPKYSSIVTTVTLDIAALGQGCELTLTHENVLSEYAERSKEGWGKILDGLAKTLA